MPGTEPELLRPGDPTPITRSVTKFFFVRCGSCVQSVYELLGKYLPVNELRNAHIVRQVFLQLKFSWLNLGRQFESCMAVCLQFLRMTIS